MRDYKQKLRARGRNAENTGGWIRDEETGALGRRPKQTKERWGEFDKELRAQQARYIYIPRRRILQTLPEHRAL